MLKITSKVRALPIRSVYFGVKDTIKSMTPLEAPVFLLRVTNWVDTGDIIFGINDIFNDIIPHWTVKELYTQNNHSFSEQTALIPLGTQIIIEKTVATDTGYCWVSAYTYYWEV